MWVVEEIVKLGKKLKWTSPLLRLVWMVPKRLSSNLICLVSLRAMRIEQFNPSLIRGLTPT